MGCSGVRFLGSSVVSLSTRIQWALAGVVDRFVKRVRVPAASEVPVMGTRRRFTPEYRRDVASLVLDTGSTIASVARD